MIHYHHTARLSENIGHESNYKILAGIKPRKTGCHFPNCMRQPVV